MPLYAYECADDGPFEVRIKMMDATWTYACPECGKESPRSFNEYIPDWIPHCDGFYRTDWRGVPSGFGTKAEMLQRQYEHHTGEKAPLPATDVPRNGGEKW